MLNYIIRKLLSMIPMLLIITFLIYLGVELMPGDVMDFLIPMDQLAEMTPEQVDAFKAAKGLDGPMIVRYFNWLKDICKGDLGYSLQNNMPVGELLAVHLRIAARAHVHEGDTEWAQQAMSEVIDLMSGDPQDLLTILGAVGDADIFD